MENKIVEKVGTELTKDAAKAATKTLSTAQLIGGGIACFFTGVLTGVGTVFGIKALKKRNHKGGKNRKNQEKPKTEEPEETKEETEE